MSQSMDEWKVKIMSNISTKKFPIRIGMRTFKTGFAAGIAVAVGYLIDSPYPPFLAIGALGCMQSSIIASLKGARDLTIGNFVGALLAMLFTMTFSGNLSVGCFFGVMIMIVVCNSLHMQPSTTSLACVVFCCCLSDISSKGNLLYGMVRFRDTCIGTAIALAVNMLIRPYSGADRAKAGILRAQQAMLPLLEQRVLRGRIPDLRDLRIKLSDLDSRIDVLLDERMNKSLKKTEVAYLRGCQQLLWKMRDSLIGICCIDTTPHPSEQNLARMNALGLTRDEKQTENILDGMCDEQDTVVFNYYLNIFLDSNEYLTQLIQQ